MCHVSAAAAEVSRALNGWWRLVGRAVVREMRRERNVMKGVGNIMMRALVGDNDIRYRYFCFECGTLVLAELSNVESNRT